MEDPLRFADLLIVVLPLIGVLWLCSLRHVRREMLLTARRRR
jgi:hypothetical protein